MQTIMCTYSLAESQMYECSADTISILDSRVRFTGIHLPGKSNIDVESLRLSKIFFTKFPLNIHENFPRLTRLWVAKSNLEVINREHVEKLRGLKQFCIAHCSLRSIKGDIFRGLKDLEVISFKGNMLAEIEPDVLNGLDNLRWVNFADNKNINIFYKEGDGFVTLDDVKQEIRMNCVPQVNLSAAIEKLEKENQKLSSEVSEMRKIFTDTIFRDFAIKVDGETFKVHKLLIASKSSLFAGIFKNNPSAVELNLEDTSEKSFRFILDFIYTGQIWSPLPENLTDVIAVVEKLKVCGVKEAIGEAIKESMGEINCENAVEILELSNRINYEELRWEAFEYIRKELLPSRLLEDELAREPDTIKMLIEKCQEEKKQQLKY